MPFIIIKDQAGELVINTDQIATITQDPARTPVAYTLWMSNGSKPIDLYEREYSALISLIGAQVFPPNRGMEIHDRLNPTK